MLVGLGLVLDILSSMSMQQCGHAAALTAVTVKIDHALSVLASALLRISPVMWPGSFFA